MIETASSNPWDTSRLAICLWVYIEPIEKWIKTPSKCPSIIKIIKIIVQVGIFICAMGFVYQNWVCTVYSVSLQLTTNTLQINGLSLSGKVWVTLTIEDQLNTLQKEKITTVTYYAVMLPTHTADPLLLDSSHARRWATQKPRANPRSDTKDFVLL